MALPLLVAACGDLPEPFIGNPGATARKLAVPPTPRLAVPAPAEALLSDSGATAFAVALADALQANEVPAVAGPVKPADWRLVARAEERGPSVVPLFTVLNPKGEEQGNAEGAPVPTREWAAGGTPMLQRVAEQAAPGIATLLTHIEAARQKADPNSLYNRPAKVLVATVTGAPGDGNAALTRLMKAQLPTLGPVVQDTAVGADFLVLGQVRMASLPDNQQRVEIQWIVKTAAGDERGRVVQLNNIPAGTLDRMWGDVAVVVANEAAGGISAVIQRQSGHDPNAEHAPGESKDGRPEPPGQPQVGAPGQSHAPPASAPAESPPASAPAESHAHPASAPGESHAQPASAP